VSLGLPAEQTRPQRLSKILTDIANDPLREQIAIADLRLAMGDRAFGAIMFLFAVPNTLPVNAPGVSAVLGLPLLFLALQLTLGFSVPWLPARIVHTRVTRPRFARVMNKVVPWLRRAERLSRPRWTWLATGLAERVIGLACVILSVVLILPVPFGNMGPALAICVLCFALMQRDGKATLAGLLTGALALALAWGVILALVKAVSLLVHHWLGT
jgi:hypothetical protein